MSAPVYWADNMALIALCASVLRQAQDDVTYAITAGWISPETLEDTGHPGAAYYANARPSRDDALDAVAFLQSHDAETMCSIVNELAGREMVGSRMLLQRAVKHATEPGWLDRDAMATRMRADRHSAEQTFYRAGEKVPTVKQKRKPWRAMVKKN